MLIWWLWNKKLKELFKDGGDMKFTEKLSLIWKIIWGSRLIIYDPYGIYGQAVQVQAETDIPEEEIHRTLLTSLEMRIPKWEFQNGRYAFSKRIDRGGATVTHSVKFYPVRLEMVKK